MSDLKLFVIIRNDLSRSQKTVQGIHAAVEFIMHEKTSWNNGTVVCLKVSDENELKLLKRTMESRNLSFKTFIEPDFGDSLTAVATVQPNDCDLFTTLQLL